MKYLITVVAGDRVPCTYPEVGDISALVDAAYDAGALGITYRVIA